jgi:hypothetical protein
MLLKNAKFKSKISFEASTIAKKLQRKKSRYERDLNVYIIKNSIIKSLLDLSNLEYIVLFESVLDELLKAL